ncbi:MAG: CRISPR-associated endonuclease Cas1 [Rhodoferax sp.]
MSLLLLDRAQLEIRLDGEALALYESGTRRGTVPAKLIDRCVIHGAATRLDTGVLLKLADAGATTVLMSPRQPRRVALVLGPQHNDAAVRLAQAQHVFDPAACATWAAALVRAKLKRQLRTLRLWQAQRPDARKPIFDAISRVQAGLDTIGPTSDTARLRGLEGAAARSYFAAMAAVMPPALGFAGRKRRPPPDPVNVGLSLSYTLAHLQAVAACQAAGLDPLLGFYHRPAIGRESLASDLIEPLRPAIDAWLWGLLRDRTLRDDHFSLDKGACILGKAGRSLYYARWEADSAPWRRWLRAQTRALAAELRERGSAWLAPLDDEDEHL